jgi:hypothetical protein
MLLRDIRLAFDAKKADRLASDELVAFLNGLEDRPWSEINRGKALTKTGLAARLRPFRISPGSIRLGDDRTPKGYYRAAFDDAFVRYLPFYHFQTATTPQAKQSAALGENQTATSGNDVAFRNPENPRISAGCGGVADGNSLGWRDHDGGWPTRDPEEAVWTE